jgi:hypothetical protein
MDQLPLNDLDLIPYASFGILALAAVSAVFLAVRASARAAGTVIGEPGPAVLAVPARFVAKRSALAGDFAIAPRERLPMDYYATFELASGERREFNVRDSDYRALAEGDSGVLLYRGGDYHGFRRQPN